MKFRIISFLPCSKLFTSDTFMLVFPLYTLKNQLVNKSSDQAHILGLLCIGHHLAKGDPIGQKPPIMAEFSEVKHTWGKVQHAMQG